MRHLVLMLSMFTSAALFAQNSGMVSGNIQDQGKPIVAATVLLLQSKDSSLVKTTFTANDGGFSFSGLSTGKYRIAVSYIGYQKYTSSEIVISAENSSFVLPVVSLQVDNVSLGSVTVTSRKPLIEMQADKLVVNVRNSIAATGNTALEVLQKAPGIAIDQNDEISVNGKSGILIYLDGKQTYLSKTDLVTMLRNMRSEQIEKLEIISNPSARYDAAGKAVINIVTTKNKDFGTNGSFTIGTGTTIGTTVPTQETNSKISYQNQGVQPRYNVSLNLNHRKGKLNVFGNAGYNNVMVPWNSSGSRVAGGSVYDQYAVAKNFSHNLNYKAGIDFYADKKNTLGFLVSGNTGHWENAVPTVTNGYIKDLSGKLQSSPLSNNRGFNTWRNTTLNANYRRITDSLGGELSIDVDYSFYNTKAGELGLHTVFLDANGQQYGTPLNITSDIPTQYQIVAGKFSYVIPLIKSKAKLEIGGKSSYVKSDNDFRFFNNGLPDMSRTNHFIYTENIDALYGMYSKQFNQTWSLQAGLRMEYTKSTGNSATLHTSTTNDYFNLFPSVFVKQSVNNDNEISYSYSRRINRPAYNSLNPFVYFLDPYTYNLGNEKLKPAYTDAYSVTYTHRHSIVISLGYTRTNNSIADVFKNAADDAAVYAKLVASTAGTNVDPKKITYQTSDNLALVQVANAGLSFPVTVSNWWSMSNNFTLLYVKYEGVVSASVLNYETVPYNFYSSQTFKLGKGLTLEPSITYNSKNIYGQIQASEQYAVNFGARKTLMKGNGSLSFSANDIFATNRFTGIVNTTGVVLDSRNKSTSRTINLSFNYKFGNNNVKSARSRTIATDEERNRIR
jgi:hypothetical protein